MKRKIFMPMAAALTMAVGISTTAMAANVTTTTDYAYGNDSFDVTVTTYVTTTEGEEVTFLVANPTVTTGTDIVYIDQQTATANNELEFTFKAKQSDLYKDTAVSAKFGTDGTDKDFGTFKFNAGVDYFTNATTQVNEAPDVTVEETGGLIKVAKFVGNVTEYGFELYKGDDYQGDLKAYASKDGVYAVQVKDLEEDDWILYPYVIDAGTNQKVNVNAN